MGYGQQQAFGHGMSYGPAMATMASPAMTAPATTMMQQAMMPQPQMQQAMMPQYAQAPQMMQQAMMPQKQMQMGITMVPQVVGYGYVQGQGQQQAFDQGMSYGPAMGSGQFGQGMSYGPPMGFGQQQSSGEWVHHHHHGHHHGLF